LERVTRWPWIRVGVRRTETFQEMNIDGSLLIQRPRYRMQQWAPGYRMQQWAPALFFWEQSGRGVR
jgi:hypothetical protein